MITDHQAIPAVASPATPTETALIEMWKKMLWVPDVGVHESFIDLGGHSLTATRCINRIRLQFQVDVPVDAFFIEPGNIASIAELIDQARATAE